MPERQTSPKSFAFADFVLNPQDASLMHRGQKLRLQDQPLRLLSLLVWRAGEVVTREEIQAHLWPENTYVEFDKSLRVAISKIRNVLRDPADHPNFIETIPRRGYRFIASVTIKDLGCTPHALGPANTAAPPVGSGSLPEQARFGHRRPSSTAIIAVLLFIVLAAALALVLHHIRRPEATPEVSAHPVPRRSIAVIGFQNLGADPHDRWLSTALQEMLSAELSASESIRLIPSEEVARAGLTESPANTPSHETLAKYAHQLGADIIVYGSFAATHQPRTADARDTLRLNLRLENFTSDAPSLVLIKTGKSSDLFNLVTATGSDLRQRLGLEALTSEAASAVRRSLPVNSAAAQFYSEGINRLHLLDYLGARELLQKAAKIEPGHAGTHLALSDAWNALGYNAQSRAEAERAVQLSDGLPRQQSLEMQGKLALRSNDGTHATEIFRTLSTFYPDNVGYALSLASAQQLTGHGKDALATLNTLNWNGISDVDRAQIEILRCKIDFETGDFNGTLASAERADVIGKALDLNSIRARALWRRAEALERLGKQADSLAASAQAQTYFHAAGDRGGEAVALLMSGDVQYDSGQLQPAQQTFASALAAFQSVGNQRNTGVTLQRLGNVCYKRGAFEQSREYQIKALAIFRELHINALVASALGDIGDDQAAEGDLSGAVRSRQDALALFESTGDRNGAAVTLNNMGDTEMARGSFDTAMQDYVKAGDLHRKTGYKRGIARSLVGQGNVLVERNDLSGAIKLYQEALKLLEGINEPDVLTSLYASLGFAELLQGQPTPAISQLQQAVDLAVKSGDHASTALALSRLSRAHIADGDIQKAVSAADRAIAESKLQFDPQVNLISALAHAHTQTSLGRQGAARDELRTTAAQAEQVGFLPLSLEARILLAKTTSSPSDRPRLLHALAQEAQRHGWKRIAAEARSA